VDVTVAAARCQRLGHAIGQRGADRTAATWAVGSVGGASVTGTPVTGYLLAATGPSSATWIPSTTTGAGQGIPAPASQGYVGWLSDPLSQPALTAPFSTTWTAGYAFYARCDVIPGALMNGCTSFRWLNVSGMSGSYLSVYTVSGTALTLVGATADLNSTATGFQRVAISAVASYTTPASGVFYVSYMNATSGVAGGPYYMPGGRVGHRDPHVREPAAGQRGRYRFMDFNGSYSTPPSSPTL
jgi:hypothetical protein